MSTTYIPQALRREVATQARFRCGYCLTQESVVGTPMEIDHLVPEAFSGPTVEENLWLACGLCNRHKAGRIKAEDPASRQEVALFNPRTQIWGDHFAWDDSATRIVGLTSIGRATVSALELNRPILVRARSRWVAAGWHPPKGQ